MVSIKQDGTMKFQLIKRGKPNVVSYICSNRKFTIDSNIKNGVIIGSKVVPIFFDSLVVGGKLLPIELSGSTRLKFNELYKASEYLLVEGRSEVLTMVEIKFNYDVSKRLLVEKLDLQMEANHQLSLKKAIKSLSLPIPSQLIGSISL